jgi:hypothetical protein
MRKNVFVFGIISIMTVIGFSLIGCASVGGGAVYDTPSVFGGHVFLDYDIGQTNVGYITGSTDAGNDNTKMNSINITQMGKFLFSINDIFLFPELGAELILDQSESILDKLLLRLGVGLDIPLNNKLFIRGEGLYGLNIGRLLNKSEEGLPNGFSVRLSLGYQIKGRKTLEAAIAEKEAEREVKRKAEEARYLEFYMPEFDQNKFDQNAFINVHWVNDVYRNDILSGTKISKIDGKPVSDYFYSRPTDSLEYSVGIRSEWYCISPGIHTIELRYRDQNSGYREIITTTAAGTITLSFEAGKAYELIATPVGDKIQYSLKETTNLKGIRYH